MLTRIEIDGFKSFERFELDLEPVAVILGLNATGKSNLFEAIHFLSNLAEGRIHEAAQGIRGELHEAFRVVHGAASNRIKIGAEFLLNDTVVDDFGQEQEIHQTRIRYEIELRRRVDARGVDRIVVHDESATPISMGSDKSWARTHGRNVQERVSRMNRRSPYLEMSSDEAGHVLLHLRQDGRAGRARKIPVVNAEATALSTVTTAEEFPHLFALRAEMREWRYLQLDPWKLREVSRFDAPDSRLSPDGSNLPAVLSRIRAETATDDNPDGVLPMIAAEVARVIPDVTGITVVDDTEAREHRATVHFITGSFPTTLVSEGTLRVLALMTFLHDPHPQSMLCLEEPENGIHPARLETLLDRVQAIVRERVHDRPIQILLNSHSPVVLRVLLNRRVQTLFADTVRTRGAGDDDSRTRTRIRPVDDERRIATTDDAFTRVATSEVEDLLALASRERVA